MPISHLNNCSDQVIDLAQVQQIYARLFMHIDAATSLLLKQDLVDAEFVREQNHRVFTKLHAIQDAALMRSSSQVPMQEAELQFHEDVSNGPTSLGDDDYGSISRRSFPCIWTKSPPLDESGLHHVAQILLIHRSGTWTWLNLLSGMIWTTMPVVLQIHCVLLKVGLMHIPFLAKEMLGIRKQEIMKLSILSIHRLTI